MKKIKSGVCVFLQIQTRKKTKNDVDGIHGVANERDMEARAMGWQMQVGVEDLVRLVPTQIIQEQMQTSVDVGGLFKSKCKQVLMLAEHLQ